MNQVNENLKRLFLKPDLSAYSAEEILVAKKTLSESEAFSRLMEYIAPFKERFIAGLEANLLEKNETEFYKQIPKQENIGECLVEKLKVLKRKWES